MELVTPIDTSKCFHCHKALTVKDRSTWFHMERKDIKGSPMGPQDPGPLRGPMPLHLYKLLQK